MMVSERTMLFPTAEHFARNFIDGRWQFPAAPFEFDICNPGDGSVIATVPLSSRLEVAKAVAAASAASAPWKDSAERLHRLGTLVELLALNAEALTELQALETGLSAPDSRRAVEATVRFAREQLDGAAAGSEPTAGGVSGHILSWGLPLTEIVTSTLPGLIRGGTVVVKPSLRGPLTPAAFAFLANEGGVPSGVVNVVQGTGMDVGADLMGRQGLSALHVRAGERTIAAAERSHRRTRVPLRVVRGGGNVVLVGPDLGPDLAPLVASVVTGVRMNSAGGSFGLPLLAVHRDLFDTVVPTLLAALAGVVAAPLPTEGLRQRALHRIDVLTRAGANVLLGGSQLPDDISHRMGWRIPPTVLMLGPADSAAVRAEQANVPLGPVLGLFTWSSSAEVTAALTALRAGDGVATVGGTV
jgi:acyl-CoA reductase-like NAD-dependent aldehyde dehydrogenase